MASFNYVQPAISGFDGYYEYCSMLMQNFLGSKHYWQIREPGVFELAADIIFIDAQKTKLEKLKLKDLRAKNYLFQAIDCSILETILLQRYLQTHIGVNEEIPRDSKGKTISTPYTSH